MSSLDMASPSRSQAGSHRPVTVDPDCDRRRRRTILRRAAAREGLDDDHAAAAAGARMREYLRLVGIDARGIIGLARFRRHVEQLTGSRDVLGAGAVGEETVVADAMEALGQHVHQEAADEYGVCSAATRV